ncbi:MAG: hypothetical protein L3J58_11755 [Emcibacter sp.]|nr:hypothetical protein [Emcibacter sp.]
MKFGQWWENMNRAQQDLAKQALGINSSLISRYSNGHLRPNNKRIQQIYVYSRGSVEPNDWFDMVYANAKLMNAVNSPMKKRQPKIVTFSTPK